MKAILGYPCVMVRNGYFIEAGSLWKYISLIRDMAFERIREAHSSTYYPISTMQGRPGKFGALA